MNILITTKLPVEGFGELMKKHRVVFPSEASFQKSELLKIVHEFDVLVPTFQFEVDRQIIDAARDSVKLIANFGVGYNNIDVDYATECGIIVTNTPDPVVEPTAEHAYALMLAVARRVAEYDHKMRLPDSLKWGVMENLGITLTGKTLGIIGMGRIGQALAKRAIAGGMQIVYHNRKRLPEMIEARYAATRMELQELIAISDVISLHAPLTEETYHLIGERELQLMKKNAILVNTARGPLIEETALIKTLRERRIYGAGIDVYEFEPVINKGFFKLDNVVLSPHNGSGTIETRIEMSRFVSENILRFLDGRTDITRVN